MSESQNTVLMDFLIKHEGENRDDAGLHKPYRDSAGVLTIGYGHTGDDFDENTRWTDEDARASFSGDLESVEAAYKSLVKVDLNPNQEAAVKSLIFNVGAGAFGKSQALKNLNNGDYAGYRKEANDPNLGFTKITDPKTGKKVPLDGLVNRRQYEDDLFKMPVDGEAVSVESRSAPKPQPEESPLEVPGQLPVEDSLLGLENAPVKQNFEFQINAPKLPRYQGQDEAAVPINIEQAPARTTFTQGDAIAETAKNTNMVRPSLWEIVKASGAEDNNMGAFNNMLMGGEDEFPIDRNYDSKEFWKTNESRFDAMYGMDVIEAAEYIGSATSNEQAESRLRELEVSYKNEQTLMQGGAKAILPRLLMSLADPVDIGVTLATLPITGGAAAAYKMGKMGKIMTGALTAATATGATEAVLASNSVFRDETDVGYATAAGFVLGGAFSSLGRADNARLQEIVDNVAKGEIDEAARKLGVDSAGAKRVAHGSDGEPTKPLTPAEKTKSFDERMNDMEDPKFGFKFLNKIMQNFQNTLFYSGSMKVRKLASGMLEGGFLKNKGVRAFTAEGRAQHVRRVFETGIFSESLPAFKAWAKRNGHSDPKRMFTTSTGEEFYSEVGRAMRGATDGISPEALEAAAKMRPFMDNMFELARVAGVKGFGSVEEVTSTLTAKTLDGTEAAVEDGFTRLYRGTSDTQGFDDVFKRGQDGMPPPDRDGQFFSSDKDSADYYRDAYNANKDARIDYIDVPTSRLDEFKFNDAEEFIVDVPNTQVTRTVETGKDMLEDYFPRMINKGKFQELVQRVGTPGMVKWYREAIISANDDISEELAEKIARGYVHTMRHQAAGLEADLLHGIRLDDVEKLREVFKDYDGIDDIITELENLKLKETGDRGTVSHSKRRIRFDETFSAPMKDIDGNEFTVRFDELLENDSRKVLKRYGQVMSGHIGMAKELGITSRAEFDEIKASIISDAEKAGGDLDAAKAEVTALDEAYNLLLGQTIEKDATGTLSMLSRTGTALTYNTRGGQFGVNALAEAGNIVGMAGVRSFLRSVPEWKSMWKRGVDGKLDHDLARTAEMLFAPGIHTLTGHAIRNLDELGEGFDGTSKLARAQAAIDPALKTMGRFTSVASGLSPITDITQRIAGVEYLRKIARFANGSNISAGQAGRLRAAGLSDEMQQRIFKQFREAGIYRKGRLVDLDPEKWLDDEALDALNMASHREMRNIIQENDISTVTKQFHHPLGRVLFQFMRFPMEAVNKQLARGIHHADAETAVAALSQLFIASTAYVAQTSIEYANDPKERKKRLDPANIARVGFMRTGMSSMLPPAIDNGRALVGADPWFAMGRSSGLGTNVVTGNPLYATTSKLGMGAAAISRSMLNDDIQFSQGDFRNMVQAIPGQRLLGVKNGIHAIEQLFPESRDQ